MAKQYLLRAVLLHGRRDPEEELDDWGFDGPTFEDVTRVVDGGESGITLHFADGGQTLLRREQYLLEYEGLFYGDFEVHRHGEKDSAGHPEWLPIKLTRNNANNIDSVHWTYGSWRIQTLDGDDFDVASGFTVTVPNDSKEAATTVAELMPDIVDALNQIPNTKLRGRYPDSYSLVSALQRLIAKEN